MILKKEEEEKTMTANIIITSQINDNENEYGNEGGWMRERPQRIKTELGLTQTE